MATIAQLIADSEQIRDETIPGANSANRVGSLFLNMANSFDIIGLNPNSIRVTPAPTIVAPNSEIWDFEIDTLKHGVTGSALSFMIHITGFGYTTINPLFGGVSMVAINEIHQVTQATNAANWAGITRNIWPQESATVLPSVRNLSELAVSFGQISPGVYQLAIENVMSGSSLDNMTAELSFTVQWQAGVTPFVITQV